MPNITVNNDLISRSAFMQKLNAYLGGTRTGALLIGLMRAEPSVDAAPIIHANWTIERWSGGYIKGCTCSNCGNSPKDSYNLPNYCDNCGAKMTVPE